MVIEAILFFGLLFNFVLGVPADEAEVVLLKFVVLHLFPHFCELVDDCAGHHGEEEDNHD